MYSSIEPTLQFHPNAHLNPPQPPQQCSFIAEHLASFPSLANMHVEKLCPHDKSVLCVPSDMPAINALAAAYTNHVSSVGILDITAHGALCGMLSVSDVRGLQAYQLDMLALPVLQFLEEAPAFLRQQQNQVWMMMMVGTMSRGRGSFVGGHVSGGHVSGGHVQPMSTTQQPSHTDVERSVWDQGRHAPPGRAMVPPACHTGRGGSYHYCASLSSCVCGG